MTGPGGYDEFIRLLREAILDEKKAYGEYTSMSMQARSLNLPADMAEDLLSIATDERKHDMMLESMLSQAESAAGYTQPTPSYTRPGERLFPSTIDDWERLANDIVAVKPELQSTTSEAVNDIRSDNEYARGSKIILTNLARDLGIK